MAKHASFMPKYANFENQLSSRKPLPIEKKMLNFDVHERECMCNFWNFGPWPSWLLGRVPRPMGLLFLYHTPRGNGRAFFFQILSLGSLGGYADLVVFYGGEGNY